MHNGKRRLTQSPASVRWALAAEDGILDAGKFVLFDPATDLDLSRATSADVTVLHDKMPDAAFWDTAGVLRTKDQIAGMRFDAAYIALPRSKVAARSHIAAAAACADLIIIDGQKTDGVDAILKNMKPRAELLGSLSKAHGKIFWARKADVADWATSEHLVDGGWHVAAGIFSADGVDPGSSLLADALPKDIAGRVADLGAGWGYLAGQALERCANIAHISLVEAQHSALSCARKNVPDDRAAFHWADATAWDATEPLDAVIMNPPFHSGRARNDDLGRAFITSAARNLRPGGWLWMVANRHLPYEPWIAERLGSVEDIGGNRTYKLLKARKRL